VSEDVANLNLLTRPVAVIQIGDRQFSVSRIVIEVRRLWKAYRDESVDLLTKIQEYEKQLEGLNGSDPERGLELTRSIADQVDTFAERKIEALLRMIELLLVKNGAAFERTWWLENADEADYKAFIGECLTKDSPSKKKTSEEEK
jgi:hypothetical protein